MTERGHRNDGEGVGMTEGGAAWATGARAGWEWVRNLWDAVDWGACDCDAFC